MESWIPSLILLIPFLGGGGALILGLFRLRLTTGIFVVLALISGLGISLRGALSLLRAPEGGILGGAFIAGGWPAGVGILLRYQGLSVVMPILFFLLGLLVLIHAIAEGERRPVFFGVYAISLGGMVGVVLSADLFNLFVFFEVLSLSAAMLIAYDRTLPAMQAAFRYLLMATLSISLYLLGLFMLYRLTGELSFSAVEAHLNGSSSGGEWRLAMVLLFGALATRVALVPFHGWLPEAHGHAPTAVSALLSGLMLKAGFVASWQLLQIFPGSGHWELLAWTGALSALIGAGAALLQEDAKGLLAFSSISQLGYIAAAAGAGALAASFYHLLSHALYKTLLFLIVGVWVHRWGLRSIDGLREKLRAPAGTGGSDIVERALLLLGVAAIIGLPPFSAFVSKGLMTELMKGSPVYPIIQLAGVLTAAALLKLGRLAIPGSAGSGAAAVAAAAGAPPEKSQGRGAGKVRVIVLTALVVLTLGLGIVPEAALGVLGGLNVLRSYDPGRLGLPEFYASSRLLEAAVAVAAGLALLLLLRTRRGRRITRLFNRFHLGVDGSMALVAFGVALFYLILSPW